LGGLQVLDLASLLVSTETSVFTRLCSTLQRLPGVVPLVVVMHEACEVVQRIQNERSLQAHLDRAKHATEAARAFELAHSKGLRPDVVRQAQKTIMLMRLKADMQIAIDSNIKSDIGSVSERAERLGDVQNLRRGVREFQRLSHERWLRQRAAAMMENNQLEIDSPVVAYALSFHELRLRNKHARTVQTGNMESAMPEDSLAAMLTVSRRTARGNLILSVDGLVATRDPPPIAASQVERDVGIAIPVQSHFISWQEALEDYDSRRVRLDPAIAQAADHDAARHPDASYEAGRRTVAWAMQVAKNREARFEALVAQGLQACGAGRQRQVAMHQVAESEDGTPAACRPLQVHNNGSAAVQIKRERRRGDMKENRPPH